MASAAAAWLSTLCRQPEHTGFASQTLHLSIVGICCGTACVGGSACPNAASLSTSAIAMRQRRGPEPSWHIQALQSPGCLQSDKRSEPRVGRFETTPVQLRRRIHVALRAADDFCFMQRILLLVQTADVADAGKRGELVVCALRRIQGPSARRVVICVDCRQRQP